MNKEECWVIQRNDGMYANKKHRWVKDIIGAYLYRLEQLAKIDITMQHSLDKCHAVKVEIKIVGE